MGEHLSTDPRTAIARYDASPMAETVTTFCRICEALCGLSLTVEQGEVTHIDPDEAHVATSGFACIKGLKQHKMYRSPDRLHAPQKRTGSRWDEIPWSRALAEIGARVKKIRDDHGPDAIAMYVGTAAGFSALHPVFAQGFMTGLGSKSMYSSATQDCANKFAVAREMYGFPFTQPFPDVDHTRCLIMVGANPAVSKWSFLQVPNPVKHLKAIEERGASLFIVDPRRTESAKAAGQHVPIRPGTDVFFYLSLLREIVREGCVDRSRVDRFMTGLDEVIAIAEPWTPERTAEVTRIPPETLRAMAHAFTRGTREGGAAIYCSTGVNMGPMGSLAFWIQEVINAISGNLDRRGGTLVGRGIIDFAAFGKKTGALLRRDRSRIGGFPSVNDAFPGGVLADEIVTPGKGQVRALFVTGGNPLITMANAGKLKQAFASLDLLVTVDLFKNETGSIAHYILPATSPLERADLPFLFPLMLGMQKKPYLQATRAVAGRPGEVRDEPSIYLDLARASGAPIFGSKIAQLAFEAMRAGHRRITKDDQAGLPEELLLSMLLRASRAPSFGSLLKHEHGVLRDDHRADDFLGKRVVTDDGRVHLAPPVLAAEAKRTLEPAFTEERMAQRTLKLITKRAIATHNSWTHNLDELVAGDKGTNHLYMRPDDAKPLGLGEGSFADVSTAVATVRLPVKLTNDLAPGVVAMPHGWGHQHADGLSVAKKTRGVNVNLLANDGPDRIERVAGMAHLTGIAVDVKPAEGPHDPTSWSGIRP